MAHIQHKVTRREACRLIALAGAGLTVGSACTSAQVKSPATPTTAETFLQILSGIREAHKLPGLAAAIVNGDEIIETGVVGVRRYGTTDKLTPDDRFHIASCTKSITATLAGLAVHRERLKWTTTLADLLPSLTREIRPEFRSATLEQLLSHRAKMPAYTQPSPQQVARMKALKGTPAKQRLTFLAEVLRNEEPNNAKGDAAYSNVGYTAAGAMIERAMKVSWEDLVQKEIVQRLGMKNVGFGYPASKENPNQPRGHSEIDGRIGELPFDQARELAVCLWPAGAVHCSIGDFALYAADHLKGLRGRTALLPSEIYGYLHRPQEGSGVFTLGWGFIQDKRWGKMHFGAGSGGWFFSYIVIVPEHNAAVVVLSNYGQAAGATRELYTLLLERFAPDRA